MTRTIAVSSVVVVTLASLTISAQQRTGAASAPAAQSARPQWTYFPERFEWQHRRPEQVGMNAALVAEAVRLRPARRSRATEI